MDEQQYPQLQCTATRRVHFTADEDAAMMNFLVREARATHQRLNMTKCWALFRNATNIRHSLGALRNRFRRILARKVHRWPQLSLEDRLLIIYTTSSLVVEEFQLELEIDGGELILDETRRIVKYSKTGGLQLNGGSRQQLQQEQEQEQERPVNETTSSSSHHNPDHLMMEFLRAEAQKYVGEDVVDEDDDDDDIQFDDDYNLVVANNNVAMMNPEEDGLLVEQKPSLSSFFIPTTTTSSPSVSGGTPSSSCVLDAPHSSNLDVFMTSVMGMFAAQKDVLEAHAEMMKTLLPNKDEPTTSSTTMPSGSPSNTNNNNAVSKKVYLHLLKSFVAGMDGVELDGPRKRINDAIRRLGDGDEKIPMQKVQMSLEAVLGWISC